jgi:glucokinase
MVRLLGDARIVIGGGLSLAGPALFGPLDAATRRLLTIHQPLRLVASAFGDRSGIYGAALLAWEHVGTIPELARRGHRPLRREPDFGSPAGVE